ncbi:MAG: flagellar basal body P-ring formation chaperone FlgA [Rickettsiales bacterium]|nr:flagellar basal body P-ring formation chaperone FlgA [Rickettsiales bacterium]
MIRFLQVTLSIVMMSVVGFAAKADESTAHLFQLTYNDAEAAIAQAISEKNGSKEVAATMTGRVGQTFYSYTAPLTVQVRGLVVDQSSSRWSANLLVMSGEDTVTAMPAAGRYDEMAQVPVLKRPLRKEDVISQDDIEMKSYPSDRLRNDTITDMAALIGQSPMRTISSSRPIRKHEIASPTLIRKNAMIQMHYTMAGMSISTTALALEDGAAGSMIAVRNLESKKTIQAIVENSTTVRVGPESQRVAAKELAYVTQ